MASEIYWPKGSERSRIGLRGDLRRDCKRFSTGSVSTSRRSSRHGRGRESEVKSFSRVNFIERSVDYRTDVNLNLSKRDGSSIS